MSSKEQARQEAISQLREILKPGDTVHTVLRHVSKSGMSRRIDVYKLENSEPRYLTGLVAKACDYSFPGKGEGLRIGGCGMDMGFAIVYDLGRTLFPNGGKDTAYHTGRNGDKEPETDGGYCLNHRWL